MKILFLDTFRPAQKFRRELVTFYFPFPLTHEKHLSEKTKFRLGLRRRILPKVFVKIYIGEGRMVLLQLLMSFSD